MALSATFTANFSSFFDAVEKADVKLKDFGAGADKVGGRLTALGNSFSGVKIVQDATLMAKAVEEIGGVSKLTEKELAKLGGTANEAVAKMKALGMEVPKNLQQIADQTKNANKATTDWMGTITKVAGAFGIAFSVSTITNFVGSVFEAASAIKDLSLQWGVSTKAVQQWTAAAKGSGVEAQTVGKSVQFLTEELGKGSDMYKALLENVGLSYEKLRKMPLEEAYKLVVKAIAGIKDETLQLDVAQGLLGESSKKMVGAIRDGFLEAADAQKFMADETIRRLTDAEAQWKKFKNNVVIWSGEMIKAWTKPIQERTKDIELFDESNKELNTTIETQAQIAARLKGQEEALKKAQQDREKALAAIKKTQDAYNQSLAGHQKAVGSLIDTFVGGDLIGKANLYLEALRQTIPVEKMTADTQAEINKVMLDAIEVYHALGQDAPQAMYDLERATQKAFVGIEDMVEAFHEMKLTTDWLTKSPIDLGEMIKLPPPAKVNSLAKDLAGLLSQSVMRAIEGGGNVFQAASMAIGTYLLDPKQSAIGKGIESAVAKLPGFLGQAINGAIPFVGALIAPAVEWLGNKIASLFGPTEAQTLKRSLIAAAGGADELQRAAAAAGLSLDALRRARGTEEIQAELAKIQDAVTFQADALQLAIETAERYGFTLEQLGPAMQRQELDKQAQQLYRDWEVLNSAGLDTILITEKMSEAVSKYVQDAMKMGREVPEAMRPMLQAMVDSGQLLDENGDAITDLEDSGISFAMTMSEGFKAMIDEVHKLTDAIERSLNQAIRDIPQPRIEGRVSWITDKLEASRPVESFQHGTGGFRNFGSGTPVVLHGWEAVVPRDDASATVTGALGASSAAAAPTVIVNAQGAFFDTPDSLQRLATKVSDALTAKYSVMGKLRAAV